MLLCLTVPGCSLPPVSPSPVSTDLSPAAEQWLQTHNNFRSLHHAPPLIWSERLAAGARAYAGTCPTGHSRSGYGENLAWASYDMGVPAVVGMWYGEAELYDYSNPDFSPSSGHFTQIVWKESRRVGCGSATVCSEPGNGMAHVWVCRYDPPGNYRRRFSENVVPPSPVEH